MHRITWQSCMFKLTALKNAHKLTLVITLNKANKISVKKPYVTFVSIGKMTTNNKKIFIGKLDRYQGITVRSDKEECTDSEFQQKLEGTTSSMSLTF